MLLNTIENYTVKHEMMEDLKPPKKLTYNAVAIPNSMKKATLHTT